MYKKNYLGRKYVVIGIFVAIAFVFLGRLFYLQVASNQYQLSARNMALRSIVEYPPRGRIFDRSHHLLVYNDAVYDLMVIPRQVKNIDTTKFCQLLGITKEFFEDQMQKAENYSYYKPSVFLKQLSKKEKGPIEEIMYEFPGFYFQTRTLRHYPMPIAANVLGNVGEVSDNDLRNDHYYSPGDYIGKSGIEKYYEKELRGKKGSRIVEVNVHNIVKGSFQGGKFDTLAVQGEDVTLGLDAKLQEFGQKLMVNKTGSIVALDPKTGEILAMVSSPSYDPNLLVGRSRSENYNRLLNDSLKPLMNRAVLGTYPPGSTFKPVDALIALDEGVITANTMLTCQGKASKPIACDENHVSPLDMTTALAVSCNSYFWKTFKRIMDDPKFDNMHDAYVDWYNKVKTFGFGETFNTDIPYERPGNIPSRRYFNKLYRGSWNALTVRSLSIGQGEILVTPIQMANEAAILANRGYYIDPHFIESIGNNDTVPTKFTVKHYVAVENPLYYKEVIGGMEQVFDSSIGTARFYKMDSITQAGKTGTAQNPHGKDHSLFIEFAPVDNPKIAIAVIIENAGYGTTWAAPIASLMVEEYLTGKITRPKLEERMLKADLNHDPRP
ncbi:MAG: penicillin-binding protein 2 [Bacteroidales bacterium]|nr:penicillin-binding protein 2 [Bacteroidales bacterium]